MLSLNKIILYHNESLPRGSWHHVRPAMFSSWDCWMRSCQLCGSTDVTHPAFYSGESPPLFNLTAMTLFANFPSFSQMDSICLNTLIFRNKTQTALRA